jgi:urease accessory protein
MTPVLAHLTGAGGLVDGLVHPVTGYDHLVAMLLVGALAYLMRDRLAWWALPAAFVATMVVGGTAGIAGVPSPGWVEVVIAASVVVLAGALLAAGRVQATAALVMVGTIALFHGLAHGGEVPEAATPALYVAGFVAATAVIHLAGVGIGRLTVTHRAVRATTAAAAAAFGLVLLTA